jgi:hypothetical protein
MPQRLIIISMIAAGLVAAAALVDIVLGIPFSQKIVMDVMFLIGAAIVIYMGYDAYRDLA